jgi:hypothetical protein
MAIGALGIKNMVKSGGILTISLSVPLTVLEAFLKDHSSVYELAGNLASDLIKIGVSSLMGYIAGILVGAWTTIVFWPVVIAIGVGIGAGYLSGYLLDKVDAKYQLAEKLSAMLEDMSSQIEQSAKNTIHDVKRGAYRGLGGFIRSQGYRGQF